jgi:hypothetical protein
MKFRKDSTKGELMDEGQIREEAWLEGRDAAYKQHVCGSFANRPENPYTPVVQYTPSDQEITDTLLGTFTEDEIGRYLRWRELNIAGVERMRIVGELKTFEGGLTECDRMLRPRVADLTKLDTVRECIALIKRKWN